MGLTFLGQIRLVCQHCLEEKIEVVETHTPTHSHTVSKQVTHVHCMDTQWNTQKNMQRCGCGQMKLIPRIKDVIFIFLIIPGVVFDLLLLCQ